MSDPYSRPNADESAGEPSSDARGDGDVASDAILLLGIRRRDTGALGLLYDRYGMLAYTLALRVVDDPDLAEEVVRNVFLRCWNGLDAYDLGHGSLAGWLLGLTRQHASERTRSGPAPSRTTSREPLVGQDAGVVGAPVRAEDVVLQAMVSQALAELSGDEREAIDLVYYGGLTQAQVAERLAEPLDAVTVRIRNGLRRLRRVLAPVVDSGAVPERGAT